MDDKEFWLEFGCNSNQTNVLASVFFQSREVVIKKLLEDAKSFDTSLLIVMLLAFFPLMVLGFGLAIPTGVFMPTILVGCVGGSLFGKVREGGREGGERGRRGRKGEMVRGRDGQREGREVGGQRVDATGP